MKKAFGGMIVVVALLLMIVGFVMVATMALAAAGANRSSGVGRTSVGPVPGIPAGYLHDAEVSGARFDVPWSVLAGIYRVECDFGSSLLAGCNPPGTENPDGAQGPGQFLAPTWRHSLAPMALIPPGPPTVSNADGFATDGDGDGVADPWDPADAIASTARLLAADGGAGNIAGAVYDYNHSEAYVDEVLALARRYRSQSSVDSAVSGPAATVLAFAWAQLGKPYRWGGAGPDAWDCSGLVMVAFEQVGIDLPHNAQAQYDETRTARVPLRRLHPGDLVFFGPGLDAIGHVGIYIGGGEMIDAPHTGASVRTESYRWSDLIAVTEPLAAWLG